MSLIKASKANLPNLRQLFVNARTELEESTYSRNAVSISSHLWNFLLIHDQFYNIVLFMSSVAVFSLVAQRVNKASS